MKTRVILLVLLCLVFLSLLAFGLGCRETHIISGDVVGLRYSGLLSTVTTIYFADGSEVVVDGRVVIETGKYYTITYEIHAGSISVISVVGSD